MPLKDKVLAAEAIWADIFRENESSDIPEWHKDILETREKLIADGSARFVDWEDAKAQIRSAVE